MSSAQFKRVLDIGFECQTEKELEKIITRPYIAYDGFEPSGNIHIAQGILKAASVSRIVQSGGKFTLWIADWFAMMNNKQGGDIKKIEDAGCRIKAIWKALRMPVENVEYLWASVEITNRASTYFPLCVTIASKFSINRIRRCSQIMGRRDEGLSCSQILYAIMQCTDVFFLNADVCQLGLDQRKVNMLAREYASLAANQAFRGSKHKITTTQPENVSFPNLVQPTTPNKPVILSHAMLSGLIEGQEKMSKSDPSSAIYCSDSSDDIKEKLQKISPNTVDEYITKLVYYTTETYNDDFEIEGCRTVDEYNLKKDEILYETKREVLINWIQNQLAKVADIDYTKDCIVQDGLLKNKYVDEEFPEILMDWSKSWKQDFEGSDIIILPLRMNGLTLGDIFTVVSNLTENTKLVLPDLSQLAEGSSGGNIEAVALELQIAVELCSKLAGRKIEWLWQSSLVLDNPIRFWTLLIELGREISVDKICQAQVNEIEKIKQGFSHLEDGKEKDNFINQTIEFKTWGARGADGLTAGRILAHLINIITGLQISHSGSSRVTLISTNDLKLSATGIAWSDARGNHSSRNHEFCALQSGFSGETPIGPAISKDIIKLVDSIDIPIASCSRFVPAKVVKKMYASDINLEYRPVYDTLQALGSPNESNCIDAKAILTNILIEKLGEQPEIEYLPRLLELRKVAGV